MDAEESSAFAILIEPLKRQVQFLQDYTYSPLAPSPACSPRLFI